MLLDKLKAERTGEYAKAADGRAGKWSEPEQVAAETHNAVTFLERTVRALLSNPDSFEDYDPARFIDPSEREKVWRETNVDDIEDIDDL